MVFAPPTSTGHTFTDELGVPPWIGNPDGGILPANWWCVARKECEKQASVVSSTAATFYFYKSFWSVLWSQALETPQLGFRESNGRKSCWTWPGSAPKPPGTFSGTFGTFSGTSLNLIRRLQCTPELFWAEDPISLRCRGKMPANTGDVTMKHVKFTGNLSVLCDFAKWYLNRSKLGVSLGTSPRHFCPFQSIKLRVYWGPRSIAKLVSFTIIARLYQGYSYVGL